MDGDRLLFVETFPHHGPDLFIDPGHRVGDDGDMGDKVFGTDGYLVRQKGSEALKDGTKFVIVGTITIALQGTVAHFLRRLADRFRVP